MFISLMNNWDGFGGYYGSYIGAVILASSGNLKLWRCLNVDGKQSFIYPPPHNIDWMVLFGIMNFFFSLMIAGFGVFEDEIKS